MSAGAQLPCFLHRKARASCPLLFACGLGIALPSIRTTLSANLCVYKDTTL